MTATIDSHSLDANDRSIHGIVETKCLMQFVEDTIDKVFSNNDEHCDEYRENEADRFDGVLLEDVCLSSAFHDKNEFDLEASELRHSIKTMKEIRKEFNHVQLVASQYDHKDIDSDSSESATDLDTTTLNFPPPLLVSPGQRMEIDSLRTWLQNNFEENDGMNIARGVMFNYYHEFCCRKNELSLTAASFGKMVRAIFPNVRTRRLGNRGYSKYHYCGIRIKNSSEYKLQTGDSERVNRTFIGDDDTNFSDQRLQTFKPQISTLPFSAESSRFLEDFPNASTIKGLGMYASEVESFLSMYKNHCQQIIYCVVRADFFKVQSLMTNFWHSLPAHIIRLFVYDYVIKLTSYCDIVLYRTLTATFISDLFEKVPNGFLAALRKFAKDFQTWTKYSVKLLKQKFAETRIKGAKQFAVNISRQTCIVHTSSTAKKLLSSMEQVRQLNHDWQAIDLDLVAKEASVGTNSTSLSRGILRCLVEFGGLLMEHDNLNFYARWIRKIIYSCVFVPAREKRVSLEQLAQQFLLRWTYTVQILIKALTLNGADSLGSYYLLSLLFTDYASHILHQLIDVERVSRLKKDVLKEYVEEPLGYGLYQNEDDYEEHFKEEGIKFGSEIKEEQKEINISVLFTD